MEAAQVDLCAKDMEALNRLADELGQMPVYGETRILK